MPAPSAEQLRAWGVEADPVLVVEDVSVRFGGVQALDGVSLCASPGQVTGLIGPNGAGKTTTFNMITGLDRPDGGRILVGGRDLAGLSPHQRARQGMARTFQRLEVFGSLSARDNILTAAEFRQGWARDGSDPRKVTEEIVDRVGLRTVAAERVDALPTGLARLVELGRGLATRPRLLLLDEPGSGLDETESEALGDLLVDLAGEGMAVLLVEHDMGLVMRVCELIFVLDFGKIISAGPPAHVQSDPAVRAAYLGAGADDVNGAGDAESTAQLVGGGA